MKPVESMYSDIAAWHGVVVDENLLDRFLSESVASRTRRRFIWTLGSGPIGLRQAQMEVADSCCADSLTLLRNLLARRQFRFVDISEATRMEKFREEAR